MRSSYLIIIFFLISVTLYGQNPYDATAKSTSNKSIDSRSEFTQQFSFINIADWEEGMKFMIEPDRMGSNYDLDIAPYKKNKYKNKLKQKDLEWNIFTVQRIEERQVKCPRGRCTRTYIVFKSEGKEYEYEFIGTRTELRETVYPPDVKKFVYLDEVDLAKGLLKNKTVYVLTRRWMREGVEGFGVYEYSPLKYIPVKITKIGVGNQDNPVRIVFNPEGLPEAFRDVSFSGTNSRTLIDLEKFDKIFSFENPRLKYPQISDEMWSVIQKSKIRIGMTKEECILSWGKPDDINKTNSSNFKSSEQWVYGKRYLYFSDGKLETVQH